MGPLQRNMAKGKTSCDHKWIFFHSPAITDDENMRHDEKKLE